MTNCKTLTSIQRRILAQAARREDGAVLPPPEDLPLRNGTLTRTLKALLRRRLIEAAPAVDQAGPDGWADNRAENLRISAAGRQMLVAGHATRAAGDNTNAVVEQDEPRPEPVAETAQSGCGTTAETDITASSTSADGISVSGCEPPPMAAAGGGAVGEPAGLAEADLAAASREAPARPRGKLGLILQRLEAGASVDELAAAAAWQKHTVRAALCRLRARGWPIRVGVGNARKVYRLTPTEG